MATAGMTIRTRLDIKKVLRWVKQKNIKSLGHAGAAIRLIARRSIRRRKGPSRPGSPPHTHTGALKSAILYAVEKGKQSVVIGPSFAGMGTSSTAHEFGGRYRRARYPKRRFMGPALEKVRNRLPKMWAGSVR